MSDYHLRPIMVTDLHLLLRWRNSERIHSQMLTDHYITWKEHMKWFSLMKTDRIKRNFIFEYRGRPIGYVGYTELDFEHGVCSPGAYLGEMDVPIDAGFYLFFMAVDYAFLSLNMERVETSVFENNRRARCIDEFLGYKVVPGTQIICIKNGRTEHVVRMAMTKQEWIFHKQIANSEG